MYKLLALDVDGTLLNSQGEVTDKTVKSIRELVSKGVLVLICTGRPTQGTVELFEKLGLKMPVIAYNGAKIVNLNTGAILHEQNLRGIDVKKIVEIGEELKTTIIIWSNNQLYTNTMNDNVIAYKKLSGVEPIVIDDYVDIIQQGATKVLWIDEVEKIAEFQRLLDIRLDADVNYCTSKPYYLEFIDKTVSKGRALSIICDKYELKREEIIAIGDGQNDITMLEFAGVGVAMGNSSQEVKDKADYITATNDEEGIALVIDKYFR
ncbi:MAG: hydrolase Cof [Alkaliphilus sp.]|nr:HAD family phosphatase [bacterium AH-315-K05]MBN4069909.1 HAD family phosphatase [bacterium AH-315-G05]MBN4074710.1 HAD family phosphatase [bacterium AH-315-E09]PHS29258.1 MAG: hydrolase Cof [Alkaliphilus sp.]